MSARGVTIRLAIYATADHCVTRRWICEHVHRLVDGECGLFGSPLEWDARGRPIRLDACRRAEDRST